MRTGLMSLIDNIKVIGIDAGTSSVITSAYRDPPLQEVHMANRGTQSVERWNTCGIPGGQWREKSGQIAYPPLMKQRISTYVPNVCTRPIQQELSQDYNNN